jgi:hypothetical protein
MLLGLALTLIAVVVSILVHEGGHALAGAGAGFRIMRIIVGIGPPIVCFRWRGVDVQINLLPLVGATVGAPKHRYRGIRLRQWFFVAGGPLANLLVCLAVRRIAGVTTDDLEEFSFATLLLLVNGSLAALNLIPIRLPDGTVSDGYALLTVPFWSRRRIEASYLLQHGSLAHRDGQHEAARALWREGLAQAADPRLDALFKNNIAFASVVIGRDEDLPEADRLSAEAFRAIPTHPAVVGTRGAVLLRLGRAAQALPLLAASQAGALDNHSRALGMALLASALAALGRPAEAVRKLAQARRAEPACDLISRAEADIAAASSGAHAPARPDPV